MSTLIVEGQHPLRGEITIPGNKNAMLPEMVASLLTDDEVTLLNVPHIRDVKTMSVLLSGIGVRVDGIKTRSVHLLAKSATNRQPDEKMVADLRASVLFLGPMLARFGKVTLRHPGGDIIGRRSIEPHLNAFAQMGVKIHKSGVINSLSIKQLRGAPVYLKEASVTATENILMAAALARGDTIIQNAACEPHVVSLGSLLHQMGANIRGLGTNRIEVSGVDRLHGATHAVRPDHIEAATWTMAAAITGGEITIHGCMDADMLPIFSRLTQMGVEIRPINCQNHRENGLCCYTARGGRLEAYPKITTNIWPGFPTDALSPLVVLATQARGTTLAHDWMYEGRMYFVDRLIKMGANIIMADPHRVIINGPTMLYGRNSSSPDIRAGMALVIAALAARGKSEIHMIELVDRGYEELDKRLNLLGASVTRIA